MPTAGLATAKSLRQYNFTLEGNSDRSTSISSGSHLSTLCSCGAHSPAEDLFDDIRKQTDCDQQDDAKPGRPAGQHLHEDVIHPLVVEKGPMQREEMDEVPFSNEAQIDVVIVGA